MQRRSTHYRALPQHFLANFLGFIDMALQIIKVKSNRVLAFKPCPITAVYRK
jgi:hypothetical protein